MSSEQSTGKPNPATQPVVAMNTSRSGLSAAITAVANAPIAVYKYSSGGRGAI